MKLHEFDELAPNPTMDDQDAVPASHPWPIPELRHLAGRILDRIRDLLPESPSSSRFITPDEWPVSGGRKPRRV